MIEPRRALTFREVARRGSFSEAARALSLTQPAVSQQVAALETELGVRLLNRSPAGLALTPAGELLLAHADALAERLDLAGSQLAELADAERRRLHVGASPSALATFVPRALGALDGAEVDVTGVGPMDELVEGVRSGRLHAAVVFQDAALPRREHEGTRRVDLFDEPFAAIVGPHHRLARRRRIELEQLAGDTWTAPSREGLIARACAAHGFEPRIALLASDPLAIAALVGEGLAVTLTPRGLARAMQGVHALTVAGGPARRSVYALLPDAGTSRLAEAFVDALAAAALDYASA
jgi:DNA-binding transcriptional LysR family regulator